MAFIQFSPDPDPPWVRSEEFDFTVQDMILSLSQVLNVVPPNLVVLGAFAQKTVGDDASDRWHITIDTTEPEQLENIRVRKVGSDVEYWGGKLPAADSFDIIEVLDTFPAYPYQYFVKGVVYIGSLIAPTTADITLETPTEAVEAYNLAGGGGIILVSDLNELTLKGINFK